MLDGAARRWTVLAVRLRPIILATNAIVTKTLLGWEQ